MGIGPKPDGYYRVSCTDDESIFICVYIYMDTMDDTKIQVRSIDEPGMEKIGAACIAEYDCDCGGDVVAEEVNGEW